MEQQIRDVIALGYSHREAARLFKVSIRQVQKAIDPERRRELDRWYLQHWRKTNPEKALERHRRWYSKHREEILARKRANYSPAKRRKALERYKAKYGPQYYKRRASMQGQSA